MKVLLSLLSIAVIASGIAENAVATALRGAPSILPNHHHHETPLPSSNQRQLGTTAGGVCASIIAVAGTRDPKYHDRSLQDETIQIDEPEFSEEEEFVCETSSTGEYLPLVGTPDQLSSLRTSLNNGDLISAETTIAGLVVRDNVPIDGGDVTSEVVLPDGGDFVFQSVARRTLQKSTRDTTQREQHRQRERRTAVYEGVKEFLVVRVTDSGGLAHRDSAREISDNIFGTYGDPENMSTQFNACSFKKLTVSNQYTGSNANNINRALEAPGVMEVRINISLRSNERGTIRNAVTDAVEKELGFTLPGSLDHVMYILEKCYVGCGWAAYAYVNSWNSVYQSDYYRYPGVQLHEIGHNLNLAHSGGLDGKTYTDHTCLMGNPLYSDDVGEMCFNPAKNYQIAFGARSWYEDRVAIYNEATNQPNIWRGRFVGIADYDNNPEGLPVVMKLETGTADDYFMGFNRAYGVNRDNDQADNQVTIVQTGNSGTGYSQSFLQTTMTQGGSYTVSNNWRGTKKSLVVTVNKIDFSANPVYADISINFDNASENPPPTPGPTPPVTARPTNTPGPTMKPTTSAPTRACGDNVCKPFENDVSCPDDCAGVELATFDGNIGGKVANGTMFTVQAIRDVAITSISTFTETTNTDLFQVYTRAGGYRLHTDSDDGWELIYDNVIKHNGDTVLTDLAPFDNDRKVVIPAGQSQSFYVYSPSNVKYRQEGTEGEVLYNDESLRFIVGISLAFGKWGEIYDPRTFSGVLTYDAVDTISGPTQEPTNAPTPVPTANPVSSAPTAIPTPLPTAAPIALPTSNPTLSCGNNICESNEVAATCPVDCSGLILTGSSETGASGAEGTMFSIKALRDVTITSLNFHASKVATDLVQVYTRSGSYKGFELTEDGWSLVFEKNVAMNARDVLTLLEGFDTSVSISAGTTQSFFIYTPSKLMYAAGTPGISESSFSSNNALELFEGIGKSSKFDGDYATNVHEPRIFRGQIIHDVVNLTPAPTASPSNMPTPVPTNLQTSSPTDTPTSAPTNAPTAAPTNVPTSNPTDMPTSAPTNAPTAGPTNAPTTMPTNMPTPLPTSQVTPNPTTAPTPNPTNMPTGGTSVCGDNVCDLSEDAFSCSADCANNELGATLTGGSGAEGTMFYVKALRDVVITSFDFHARREAQDQVQVYTRSGTYKGYEGIESAWDLVYDRVINMNVRNTPTPLDGLDTSVFVAAGAIQSFYIYTPNKLMYAAGTTEEAMFSENGDLEFYEGMGLAGNKFSSDPNDIYEPRVFRGKISYAVSSCGNNVCGAGESVISCPVDCGAPMQLDASSDGGSGTFGTMFYVKALSDVAVTSFAMYSARAAQDQVQVYTRPGKYSGHEHSDDGWTLVYDNSSVNLLGRNDPTELGGLDTNVFITAGSFQSFYIFSPRKVMYQQGSTVEALYSNDKNLEFYEGIGVSSNPQFSGDSSNLYEPRVFRGSIRYEA